MKTITLKMRDSPGYFQHGGQRGDHRMCELIIPLPREKVTEIQSCVALFSCDDELVLSPIILPSSAGDCYIRDGKVHIVLWQRLTQCWVLRVQLECYGDAQGAFFIDRTVISEPVVFAKSLADGVRTDYLPEPSALTELLESMHRHGNMTVLEELGDAAGDLTYRGESLYYEPITNMELNELINQALAAVGG